MDTAASGLSQHDSRSVNSPGRGRHVPSWFPNTFHSLRFSSCETAEKKKKIKDVRKKKHLTRNPDRPQHYNLRISSSSTPSKVKFYPRQENTSFLTVQWTKELEGNEWFGKTVKDVFHFSLRQWFSSYYSFWKFNVTAQVWNSNQLMTDLDFNKTNAVYVCMIKNCCVNTENIYRN